MERKLYCNGMSVRKPMKAEHQLVILQDTLSKLEEELFHATNQAKKCAEQRDCLMVLVKRAWTGDSSAARSLANIVGVAPPTVLTDSNDDEADDINYIAADSNNGRAEQPEESRVHMATQPRAISNWANLSVGLLNRHYSDLEFVEAEAQQHHMLQRQAYLDQQLLMEYNTPKGDEGCKANSELLRSFQPEARVFPVQRVGSAQRRPLGRCRSLTRPSSAKVELDAGQGPGLINGTPQRLLSRQSSRDGSLNELDKSNLYISAQQIPTQQHSDPTLDSVWCPSQSSSTTTDVSSNNNSNCGKRETMRFQPRPAFDSLFKNEGLFNPERVVGANSRVLHSRPPSGKQQHAADAARAQPRLVKGRPATAHASAKRPIPAAVAGNKPQAGRPRIGSAPQHQRRSYFSLDGKEIAPEENWAAQNLHFTSPRTSDELANDAYRPTEQMMVHDLDLDLSQLHLDQGAEDHMTQKGPQKKLTFKPDVVDGLETDIKRAMEMEKRFKDSAIKLQKKIGIPNCGIIF